MTEPIDTERRTVLRTIAAGLAAGGVFAGPAAAGDHALARELNTVRAATRKYRDVAAARADGYERLGVVEPVGVVFNNADFMGNTGHTDPPANLFYAPNRSGETEDSDLVLAGIEYHVPGRDAGDQDIFADEGASRRLEVTEAEGWHPNPFGGEFTGLHVWPHLHNPEGVFALEHATIRERLTG